MVLRSSKMTVKETMISNNKRRVRIRKKTCHLIGQNLKTIVWSNTILNEKDKMWTEQMTRLLIG